MEAFEINSNLKVVENTHYIMGKSTKYAFVYKLRKVDIFNHTISLTYQYMGKKDYWSQGFFLIIYSLNNISIKKTFKV